MFPAMKTVVVAIRVLDSKSMHVMFNVPFRLSLTEIISNVDIRGVAPVADILKTVPLEEFIITLGISMVVDEIGISFTG